MKELFYMLILMSFSSIAQPHYKSCPLDSTSDLELTYMFWATGVEDSILFQSFVTSVESPDCELHGFDCRSYSVTSNKTNNSFTCLPEKITKLNIWGSDNHSNGYVFNLDTFEVLNSLHLPELQHLSIAVNY